MKRTLFVIPIIWAATSLQAFGFELTSPDMKAGETASERFEFNGFGCSGDNKSPVLNWHSAPRGAKSFAVTVYDPDARTGSGWWHWMVINIPAGVTGLESDAGSGNKAKLPDGASHVRNDYGATGWGGFCPPRGDRPHRYVFAVHALKVDKLEVPAGATPALTGYLINSNLIAKATFTVDYGRKK